MYKIQCNCLCYFPLVVLLIPFNFYIMCDGGPHQSPHEWISRSRKKVLHVLFLWGVTRPTPIHVNAIVSQSRTLIQHINSVISTYMIQICSRFKDPKYCWWATKQKDEKRIQNYSQKAVVGQRFKMSKCRVFFFHFLQLVPFDGSNPSPNSDGPLIC